MRLRLLSQGERVRLIATPEDSVDLIGASGGYQVRAITVDKPTPLCSYQSAAVLAEADAAFMAAVKDGYIETWNKSIDARTPLLPKSAEQKSRYNYYKSKEIRAGKEVEQNRHRYLRTAQQTQTQTNRHGSTEERERYLRAACIEKAYSAGRLRGSNKAEEDVRAVIDKAPGD